MATRPDVAFVVGHLGRWQSAARKLDWTAVLHVVRYLHGMANHRLTYCGTASRESYGIGVDRLQVYCVADYGECRETRRSTSGYAFLLANGAISWCSGCQEVVATSTTEFEYISLAEAAKEAVWIRRLLAELGHGVDVIELREDNHGVMLLAKNPVHHLRSMHIDIHWHYIRECIERGDIRVIKETTEDMTADILTKSLHRIKHAKHALALGLLDWKATDPRSGGGC